MLFSIYLSKLINYDNLVAGSYPHGHKFYHEFMPAFNNELHAVYGETWFQRKIWETVIEAGVRVSIPPTGLLRFVDKGVIVYMSGINPFEIRNGDENPMLALEREAQSTPAGYPKTYRLTTESPTYTTAPGVFWIGPTFPAGWDGNYFVLDYAPITQATIRSSYIAKIVPPANIGDVFTDIDLNTFIRPTLVPALVCFHRAQLVKDRVSGAQDTRYSTFMREFHDRIAAAYASLGSPMGYNMVESA